MVDNLDLLRDLYLVPPGSYNVTINRPWWRWWLPVEQGGWLTVEKAKDGLVSVMWTTDKDSHWPYGEWGCAKSVSLKADGALVSYFESAVTMWLKWGYGSGSDVELRKAMDFCAFAHSRLCQDAHKVKPFTLRSDPAAYAQGEASRCTCAAMRCDPPAAA